MLDLVFTYKYINFATSNDQGMYRINRIPVKMN